MRLARSSRFAVVFAVLGFVACDNDSGVPAGDAGRDSGKPDRTDSGPTQAEPVKFAVPENGGSVEVPTQNGAEPTKFEFPPSSAGKMVTLTPVPATEIGWPADQFAEVIRMEPDGATFEEPIVIRPASGDVIVLDFPSGASKSAPEALPLNDDGDGFLLSHFSTLVVVPPANSCAGNSGWNIADAEKSQAMCKDAEFPQYISFGCSEHVYCVAIEASCCARAGATACSLRARELKVRFTRAPYDERYPYCGGKPAEPKAGSGGAGQGGAGSGGAGQGGAGEGGAGSGVAGTGEAGSGGAGQGGAGSGVGEAGTGEAGSGGAGQGGSGQGGAGSGAAGDGEAGGGGAGTSAAGSGGAGSSAAGSGGAGSSAAGSGGAGSSAAGSGAAGGGAAGGGGYAGKPEAGSGGVGGHAGGAAGGGGAGGSVSCDQAGTWQNVANVANVEYFTAVWGNPTDDGDVWAVGKATAEMTGIVAHWNGSSWTTELAGPEGSVLNGVWASTSGTVYVVGSGGAIYRRLGDTWSSFPSPTDADLYGIWGKDAFHFWVVGASGEAHYYDGEDWVDHSITGIPTNQIGTLRSVWSADAETVWVTNYAGVASDNHYVLHRFHDGAWTAYSSWSYYTHAVWGTSNDDIWAVGYSKGTSAHFDGTNWTASTAPAASPYLNSVWGRNSHNVWAVGDGGQIDYWNGSAWSACTKVTQNGLNAVTVTASSAWAVGVAGIVLRND